MTFAIENALVKLERIAPETPIMVNQEEYDAYHTKKLDNPDDYNAVTPQQVLEFLKKERDENRIPNLTVFFWQNGLGLYRRSMLPSFGKIDLSKSDLHNVIGHYLVFYGTNFSHADFSGAMLEEIFFYDAAIDHAVFEKANLRRAYFDLYSINGNYANFKNANLTQATLKGDFSYSDFRNADMRGGADLSYGIFKGADFTGAYINNVKFDFTNLEGAIGIPQAIINKSNAQYETNKKQEEQEVVQNKLERNILWVSITLGPLFLIVFIKYYGRVLEKELQNKKYFMIYSKIFKAAFLLYMIFALPFFLANIIPIFPAFLKGTVMFLWVIGWLLLMIEVNLGLLILGIVWIINHISASHRNVRLLYGYALPIIVFHIVLLLILCKVAPDA